MTNREKITDKLNNLKELKDVTYNCEDSLDGEYNARAEGYERFEDVNSVYLDTLRQLKILISVIDSTLKEYPDDILDEIED